MNTEPNQNPEKTPEIIDQTAPAAPQPEQPKKPDQNKPEYRVSGSIEGVYEITESLVHAVIIAIILLTVFFRVSIVEGSSMNQTLQDKDVLVISDFLYKPAQGDIVVLQPLTERMQKLIIKRVIATGGQTVDIDFENWIVYVDGEPVELPRENYVNYRPGEWMYQYDITFPHTVPEGKVFVMGDNRNDSTDSRSSAVGDVDEDLIVGHALYRFLPFNQRKNLTK